MGDVLRTTPLLRGLKEKFPSSSITWLTYEDSLGLLENNKFIDRIYCFGLKDALSLQAEEFDLLINLDKDKEALALASLIKASVKKGFGINRQGNIIALNPASEYSVELGIDDELKFYKNQKTYPELIFEAAELDYDKRYEYILDLSGKSIKFAERFFADHGVSQEDILVGINTGAGRRFANKNLSAQRIAELINKLARKIPARFLLLGGPLEIAINQKIKELVSGEVIDSGCLQVEHFSGLVNRCSMVICADTLALHVAVAFKKPLLALFGPTCHQEIELYGRGNKIISPIECAPCYKKNCDKHPNCMDLIDIDKVYSLTLDLLSGYMPHTFIKKQ